MLKKLNKPILLSTHIKYLKSHNLFISDIIYIGDLNDKYGDDNNDYNYKAGDVVYRSNHPEELDTKLKSYPDLYITHYDTGTNNTITRKSALLYHSMLVAQIKK